MTTTITQPTHRPTDWSPAGGYHELMPGAWARATDGGFRIVVLTAADPDGGTPALVSGPVTALTMLSADTWLADAALLRTLAARDFLTIQVIGPDHPALLHVERHVAELGCGIRPEQWVALGLELTMLADHDIEM